MTAVRDRSDQDQERSGRLPDRDGLIHEVDAYARDMEPLISEMMEACHSAMADMMSRMGHSEGNDATSDPNSVSHFMMAALREYAAKMHGASTLDEMRAHAREHRRLMEGMLGHMDMMAHMMMGAHQG